MGCLGAAMCAGIGAGLFRDSRDAISKCVRLKKIYTPDPKRSSLYAESFARWNAVYSAANRSIYV